MLQILHISLMADFYLQYKLEIYIKNLHEIINKKGIAP